MFAAFRKWRQDSDDPRTCISSRQVGRMISSGLEAEGGQEFMDDRSRFRGCLLGGAVGDALGSAVEFINLSEIIRRYGPSGLRDYDKTYGRQGAITDDTQMTLFTAEGLIRAQVQKLKDGSTNNVRVIANAYLRWLLTQSERNEKGIDPLGLEPGWLFGIAELHAQRTPGRTCRSALRDAGDLGLPALNDSPGCGGMSRVAPVGLMAASLQESFKLGREVSALTHGHPTVAMSGGALAMMIAALRRGVPLADAIDTALKCISGLADHEQTTNSLQHAVELARTESDSDVAIAKLGEGWIAQEALAIATYCALVADDFDEGILMAVNHDGNSDSTAAIAGNLLGAMGGEGVVSSQWLDRLELNKVIGELADDLYECAQWSGEANEGIEAISPRILSRYPGN
jgi:ADP-ribosyl-[dinitrogen reductase] hydrolase